MSHSSLSSSQDILSIAHVSKSYGAMRAVNDVSLEIQKGEFFALLGPSGCGKTTLLRMIAGFEEVEAGQILLDGEEISHIPPWQRPLNMMFQSYALFPHLNVAENIAFGLKYETLSAAEKSQKLEAALQLVQLKGFETRKISALSGGQKARVALARALIKQPKLLLLDEPLAALDKKLRQQTQDELKALQKQLGLTFIIVTHDREEAFRLATRVGVMEKGVLVQVDTPQHVYNHPATKGVAELMGDVVSFAGQIVAAKEGAPHALRFESTDGSIHVSLAHFEAHQLLEPLQLQEGAYDLCLRPEHITHQGHANNNGANNGAKIDPAHIISFPARLESVKELGAMKIGEFKLDSGKTLKIPLQAEMSQETRADDRVRLCFDIMKAMFFASGAASHTSPISAPHVTPLAASGK